MFISNYIHSLVDLIVANPNLALLIVFLISAGEALFVVGLFVPSTVVLVAAGTMVGMGKLGFAPIFLAASFGAIVGDGVSFWFGHVWKETIRQMWPFNRYSAMLDSGEAFFRKHGGKSVFIGRFIPGVKAVVPGIAGMMGMSVTRFTVINILSAFAWAGAHIIPSIALGHGFDLTKSANPHLAALLAVAVIGLPLVWYLTTVAIGFALPHLGELKGRFASRASRHNAAASAVVPSTSPTLMEKAR